MFEFNNVNELRNYYYNSLADYMENHDFLFKKLSKKIENDFLNEYSNDLKLLQYNSKFMFKMKFKELLLERKLLKKNFRKYKKGFRKNFKLIEPDINVAYSSNPIYLSKFKLPKIKCNSSVPGKIKWCPVTIKPGQLFVDYEFIPDDSSKYIKVVGSVELFVIDDITNNIEVN